MPNTLTRSIALGPSRVFRRGALEPLLQLISGHIDRVVEVPAERQQVGSTFREHELDDIFVTLDHFGDPQMLLQQSQSKHIMLVYGVRMQLAYKVDGTYVMTFRRAPDQQICCTTVHARV